MKRLFTLLIALVFAYSGFSQVPEKMSYQAVIRNSSDELVKSNTIGMQISILQGSESGTPIYVETHSTSTNINGLATVEIGGGIPITGTFSDIDWSTGIYFLKTETDPAGGTSYSITGSSQILSVPYALHSKSAETITGQIDYTETDPIYTNWDKSSGILIAENQISDLKTYLTTETDPVYTVSEAANITSSDITNLGSLSGINTGDQDLSSYATKDMGNQNITNLANPSDDQDAATKAYVDVLEAKINMLYNTLDAGGKVTDIDGNSYNTVKIGTQVWMAENLKTTKYNDGTDIPLVTDSADWSNLVTPGYCWYNNDSATYGPIYGALYNWYTVNTEQLCPSGWHVPNNSEFFTLTNFLGGYGIAGAKLKMKGTVYWNSPNIGATNETGFAALPGGYRDISSFKRVGDVSWFVSSEVISGWVAIFFAGYDMTNFNYGADTYTTASSVRCLKD